MEKHKNLRVNETLKILRGTIPSLIIYEVAEHELKEIERGEKYKPLEKWGNIFLTVSISLFPAWATGTSSEFLNQIFLCAWIIGAILGTVLIYISKQEQNSMKTILKQIRGRKPKS